VIYGARVTEKARIVQTFPCQASTFQRLFLGEEYNKALFEGHLHFPTWKVASERIDGSRTYRTIDVEPYVPDLPPVIQKVVGDNLRYREEAYFDADTGKYHVRVVPNRLADKILVTGVQTVEEAGAGSCRRIFDANVEVKIFGVGGLIEKKIVHDLIKSYDVGAKFTEQYLAEKSLLGQ
jgi:Protein of unknown function (DUF2505)